MKTLACFVTTWITATALLVWMATRHNSQGIEIFRGTQFTLTMPRHNGPVFWHSLWVAGVFSLLNTFIVRFWQMQWELKEKGEG